MIPRGEVNLPEKDKNKTPSYFHDNKARPTIFAGRVFLKTNMMYAKYYANILLPQTL